MSNFHNSVMSHLTRTMRDESEVVAYPAYKNAKPIKQFTVVFDGNPMPVSAIRVKYSEDNGLEVTNNCKLLTPLIAGDVVLISVPNIYGKSYAVLYMNGGRLFPYFVRHVPHYLDIFKTVDITAAEINFLLRCTIQIDGVFVDNNGTIYRIYPLQFNNSAKTYFMSTDPDDVVGSPRWGASIRIYHDEYDRVEMCLSVSTTLTSLNLTIWYMRVTISSELSILGMNLQRKLSQ